MPRGIQAKAKERRQKTLVKKKTTRRAGTRNPHFLTHLSRSNNIIEKRIRKEEIHT